MTANMELVVVRAGVGIATALKKNSDKDGGGSGRKKDSDKDGGGSERKKDYCKDGGGGELNKNLDKDGAGREQKKNPDKDGGGSERKKTTYKDREQKKNPKKDGGSKEDEEKKQPSEETTVLLRIRLHCDGCVDRIKRSIYRVKGVNAVVVEDIAKHEVKVVGTMDVAAMVVYLNDKLSWNVKLVGLGKKDDKKDKDGSGDREKMEKDEAATVGDVHKDKGKRVEVAGPSMALAPAGASTHNASPYSSITDPQVQGIPPSNHPNYYGGNADGVGYANAGSYYPPYLLHRTPPPQMFSDENPHACSVM